MSFRPLVPFDFSQWHLPVTLRPYQREALDAWLRARGKGSIEIPTAGGKTWIGIAGIVEMKTSTVILVPLKVLVDQWIERLRQAGIQATPWYGEEKVMSPVIVALYQSLYSDPSIIASHELIIADEAHHLSADQWSALLRASVSHPYTMALTATLPTDAERRELITRYLPVVYQKSPSELAEAGHVAPLEIIPYGVSLPPDMDELYQRFSRFLRSLSRLLGTADMERIGRLTQSEATNIAKAARQYQKAWQDRRAILSSVPEKARAVLDIVSRAPRTKTLVFATTVKEIESVCSMLVGNGIPCRIITGETLPRFRHAILRDFGKTFWVIGSIDVLSEGWDVTDASTAIIVGGGRGERKLIQRTGRVLRPAPGKQARLYIVYAANTTEAEIFPTAERILLGQGEKFFTGEPVETGLYGYGADAYKNRRVNFR